MANIYSISLPVSSVSIHQINPIDFLFLFVDDPTFISESRRQYVQCLKHRDGLRPLIMDFSRRLCIRMKDKRTVLEKNGLLSEWQKCGLFEFSHRMIYQSSTKTLFGEIDSDILEKDFRLFDKNLHHFSAAYPSWVYSYFFADVLKARSRLNYFWSENRHPQNESEFMRIRKAHFLANSNLMSEKDRYANQTGLFWGSLGNAIPATFWCLFYLLQDTKAIETLTQEIDRYLPILSLNDDDDDEEEWTLEQLNSCVYLESTINETLRLAGAPMITRKCLQQTELVLNDGRTIKVKPNETVAWLTAVTHRDPKIFPEPEKFLFDRFIDKNPEALPGFMPFGGGKSTCPGRFFAKNEIKICVASLLRYFEYKLVQTNTTPVQQPQRVGFGVAPPDHDIPIMYRYKI